VIVWDAINMMSYVVWLSGFLVAGGAGHRYMSRYTLKGRSLVAARRRRARRYLVTRFCTGYGPAGHASNALWRPRLLARVERGLRGAAPVAGSGQLRDRVHSCGEVLSEIASRLLNTPAANRRVIDRLSARLSQTRARRAVEARAAGESLLEARRALLAAVRAHARRRAGDTKGMRIGSTMAGSTSGDAV